eukprot:1361432-Amphidinium_carterae.2
MEQAKLEQLAWREDTMAQDIRVARETILNGNMRHVNAALADMIKESRNEGFSVSETAWSRTPQTGLLEWINQVDAQDAKGLKAMIASQPQQDLMPTTIAIFSNVDAEPNLMQTPEKRSRIVQSSSKTSNSKTFDVTAPSELSDRS